MKIPLSWLSEYVELPATVEELSDLLTFSGIEVEAVETTGGAPAGVVAAKVLTCVPHPDSDHLHICEVDAGTGTPATVVCGAPNVEAGGTYPFAPLGTVLPGNFKIEKRKVRGIESFGMLCAADELGLSKDHSGLMVLDGAVAAGTPLTDLVGAPETVLEVEITPNRGDELSLVGVAREISALRGVPVKLPATDYPVSAENVASAAHVAVETDAADCPRYTARLLRGVKPGPSPEWMRSRLEAAGVRAISNVVDITNYVMLECGQPLHAFDFERLAGGGIRVRRAKEGESLVTLDGIERKLTGEMIAICDEEKPLAVAGIMGGEESGINDATSSVLLEAATFSPSRVRATGKALGLSSESSYRYVRGVTPDTVDFGARRAMHLFCAIAGATACDGVLDSYPAPQEPLLVRCRLEKLETLLGIETTTDEMARIFSALGLGIAEKSDDAVVVRVPLFRTDLTREADLIEEFIRIYGLGRLPEVPPAARLVPGADDRPFTAKQRLQRLLAGAGLTEAMNYSFTAPALLDRFGSDAARRVQLCDPLSADQSVLRDSLLPQLVENLGTNVFRQGTEAALFETGRVFFLDKDGTPAEEDRLAVALLGAVGETGTAKYRAVTEEKMFAWIRGLWETVAKTLKLRGAQLRAAGKPYVQARRGLDIVVEGKKIGHLGLLGKSLAAEWRIRQAVGVLEVSLAPLLAAGDNRKRPVPPPAYPSVRRDVALVVPAKTKHEDVLKAARKAAPKELEKIELFDVFRGKALGEGKKSLAYAFTYRAPDRTLTDEAANAFQEKINSALVSALNAEIRKG
jgi:phenylalanyl-tRNA synthetase beta chain